MPRGVCVWGGGGVVDVCVSVPILEEVTWEVGS